MLKPDIFPTQFVHQNIVQMLQDKENKINKYGKSILSLKIFYLFKVY